MSKLTAVIKKGDANFDYIVPGGMEAMDWNKYIECYSSEMAKNIEAIKECILNSEFKESKADEFCNDHYFELSNGMKIAFTWRAWGDLLSSMRGKKEGYMVFYM